MNSARQLQRDQPLIFVTPTYPRRSRLGFLERCARDFSAVRDLFWLVVEDDAATAPDVERLLAQSGVRHLYLAHGPTRKWGNAQRDHGLRHIRDQCWRGVVYLADDDNKYAPPLFDELRKVERLGVLPVGRRGPWGIERPIVRDGRLIRWNADWKRRKYPVDMAGFAFRAELLPDISGEIFRYRGGGGESELIDLLIKSPVELEFLCNDCRDCHVWHNLPLGWSARRGLAAYIAHRRTPGFIRRPAYRLIDSLGLRGEGAY